MMNYIDDLDPKMMCPNVQDNGWDVIFMCLDQGMSSSLSLITNDVYLYLLRICYALY